MTKNKAKPLHIYTLGNFIIQCDSHSLSFQKKHPKKLLALLKMLISFGSFNVNLEKITDTLWPDSEGDNALQVLHTTLHRLRKLLGDHRFILLQNGKVCLNSDMIWIDLWEFQYFYQLASQTRFINDNNDRTEKCKHHAWQALKCYQGSYLQNEVEEYWLLNCRERSQIQYHQLLQFYNPTDDPPISLGNRLFTASDGKQCAMNTNEELANIVFIR